MTSDHERRKSEHIDIVLNKAVEGKGITTGFENYRFVHQALPEIDFHSVDLQTHFILKEPKTPFLISSMTGGTQRARDINRHLAIAAERRGWSMGVGSTRAAIEDPNLTETFNVRHYAPTIPILANLGAVQFNYGYGIDQCRRAVELVEADGLILHLNSLQEVFQTNGDTNFDRLLPKIERICSLLDVPVGVKEVGWGIDGDLARKLFDAGVHFVDVAGAGGTSWIQVEKNRSKDPMMIEAAEAFADWGIPTSDCLVDVRCKNPDGVVVASGGMKSGVDAAKALALGSDLVGFGRSMLASAIDSAEAVEKQLERFERELQIAMFGIGVKTIDELRRTDHLVKK